MKKINTLIAALFCTTITFAQAPQTLSYQAVIRNASNNLVVSSFAGMKVSILQGSSSGTVVYTETHNKPTNANGLLSVEIGGGAPVTGTFSAIDWAAGPYFLKTETDPAGGTNYSITGISQLLSVPYALYAASANEVDGDSTNELQALSLANDTLYLSKGGMADLSKYNNDGEWALNGSKLYNQNSGNVGIGTNNPQKALHLYGTVSNYPNAEPANGNEGVFMDIQNAGLGYQKVTGIRFKVRQGVFENAYYHAGILFRGDAGDIDQRGNLYLCNKNGANATGVGTADARLTVTPEGNIGIGTTDPQRVLHVNSIMRLEPMSSAPSPAKAGDMYFDSTLKKLRVYDGSAWNNCW